VVSDEAHDEVHTDWHVREEGIPMNQAAIWLRATFSKDERTKSTRLCDGEWRTAWTGAWIAGRSVRIHGHSFIRKLSTDSFIRVSGNTTV
jgi:hypothetical protein